MKKCKFCGREVHTEKYLSTTEKDITCGQCTAYCVKKCELGKSGKVQGWHFAPCLSCEKNPYNKAEGGGKTARKLKGAGTMTPTMKYEKRTYFDGFGTGNFTEVETERISFDVTPEKADRFAHFWTSTGCKYYETSKAFIFEKQTDARHFIQYILYKQ